jgi:hypothetical protein
MEKWRHCLICKHTYNFDFWENEIFTNLWKYIDQCNGIKQHKVAHEFSHVNDNMQYNIFSIHVTPNEGRKLKMHFLFVRKYGTYLATPENATYHLNIIFSRSMHYRYPSDEDIIAFYKMKTKEPPCFKIFVAIMTILWLIWTSCICMAIYKQFIVPTSTVILLLTVSILLISSMAAVYFAYVTVYEVNSFLREIPNTHFLYKSIRDQQEEWTKGWHEYRDEQRKNSLL